MADGRTGRGSDDGGGDGNVDGGSGGVNLGGAIDGIIGSRVALRARKGGTTRDAEKNNIHKSSQVKFFYGKTTVQVAVVLTWDFVMVLLLDLPQRKR